MTEEHTSVVRRLLDITHFQLILTIAFTVIEILVIWQTSVYTRNEATHSLIESSDRKLGLFVNSLSNELDKHSILPQVLSKDERITRLLGSPENPVRQQLVNEHLEYINSIARTSDTYVLDREGTTIAASNWNQPDTFLNLNFSFRPYFQQAIKGQLGLYPALGSASHRRGYYYAHPIQDNHAITGVAVVKISPEKLEKEWVNEDDYLFVTDQNGVIFISNKQALLFHTVNELPDDVRQRILESRQYADQPLSQLPLRRERVEDDSAVFMHAEHASDQVFPERAIFLYQQLPVGNTGWHAHIFTDANSIFQQILFYLIGSGAVVAVIFLILSYMLQRYRNTLQAIEHQKEIERTILETNKTLELKVVERTVELVDTNRQLEQRIQQHKEAEAKLIQAKDQLLQSSKLALVGEMSAGIAHELSQPLTAIRNYIYTAELMIEQGRFSDLDNRLVDIRNMTERMVSLTRQLRGFSRKSVNEISSIKLVEALEASAQLIQQAHRQAIDIIFDISDRELTIRTDRVQFEQVLINLLKNAVDAMASSQGCQIDISARQKADEVIVTVRDHGPGIPAVALDSLFKPFFTTKQSRAGLGLGLSISRGIMNNLGGSLTAGNHPEGGALFTLVLPTEYPNRDADD